MKRRTPILLACGAALLVGACADYYPPPPPPPGVARDHHIHWCLRNHYGYDPRSNVYIAGDGSPHYCVAPWER